MTTTIPECYKSFKCIADKCPDTCCAGWDIVVDENSEKVYNSVSGNIGEKLRRVTKTDKDGDRIFELKDGRCPFLDNNNLCDIYIKLGRNNLCSTCQMFPRFFDDYIDERESGIGLACPEAARIILESENPFQLTCTKSNDTVYENCADEFVVKTIKSARKKMFEILESDISFHKKIIDIIKLAENVQSDIDDTEEAIIESDGYTSFNVCKNILKKMEFIDSSRLDYILKIDNKINTDKIYIEYENDFIKLMQYYIFRYSLKASFDYDFITKIEYGIFACIVISRIYASLGTPTLEDRIKIMYQYSREIEYSQINMDILDDELAYNFTLDVLLRLI